MTPIKTARIMRGMTQKELADKLGMSAQMLNNYESGTRMPGSKVCPMIADALHVSIPYLRGEAQQLAVWDWAGEKMISCPIISETVIDNYGIFYLVDVEEIGAVAVILSCGIQFTPSDWQGRQPLTREEIGLTRWVNAAGADAIMLDGLPRIWA